MATATKFLSALEQDIEKQNCKGYPEKGEDDEEEDKDPDGTGTYTMVKYPILGNLSPDSRTLFYFGDNKKMSPPRFEKIKWFFFLLFFTDS